MQALQGGGLWESCRLVPSTQGSSRPANKLDHRNARQAQSPTGEQCKGRVLAHAGKPGGGVEQDQRALARLRFCIAFDLGCQTG